MSLQHPGINFRPYGAVRLNIARAGSIFNNEWDWVLLQPLQIFKIVVQDNLLHSPAMGVLALLGVRFHLLYELASLPLQDLHVLVFLL